jgi:tetratricopeptide (TPR) repeat protein
MTGRIIIFSAMSLLFTGCVAVKDEGRKEGPPIPLHIQRQQREGTYGFKRFPGVGWKYIAPGMDAKILKFTPTQLMDHARTKLKEADYDEALFAARLYLLKEPTGDSRPEAQMIVATVYEKRGLDEYAFEEYQKLLDQYPKYEQNEEALKRMYEIASRFLDGQWFRWKLPYQETVFLPTGPSMHRTSQLFTQIVTNAPYGTYAAQSQYGIGFAHEKRLQGFWGFFADENEYEKAAKAYQLLADRYSRRGGDGPRSNQKELDEIVATARFRMAKLYEVQANEGIYDQSMANRAIDAYEDFRTLHGDKAPQAKRVAEAGERIKAMRMERANGLKAIAEFYEQREKWVAAQKYYGLINGVLIDDVGTGEDLLHDPTHQKEANRLNDLAQKKGSTELRAKRIQQALASHARGRKAENQKEYEQARRYYRVTNLNLHSLAELDDKKGMTGQQMKDLATTLGLTPATIAQALKAKAGVGQDLLRLEKRPSKPGP